MMMQTKSLIHNSYIFCYFLLAIVNFLSGIHECGWYDKFSVQGYNDNEFVFGVMCDGMPDWDDDDDIKQKDVWDGQRMVTGISLPREFHFWW